MLLRPLCMAAAVAALPITGPVHAQTQMEMTTQAGTELQRAEDRLAKVYADLSRKIHPDSKAMLDGVQQTWLRFREEECAFETRGSVGGSVHRMVVFGCKTTLTNERIKQLEYQLNCQEGDFSCSRN
ncbi:MAG: DUF1311 domain-containing protein [Rhodospirillales bacterium]|nr:DUF1311 domain-containing protein [Rhodospirillales bacterium]